MPDKINITILEDGTISFNTDKVSEKNHKSADDFLNDAAKLAGGERETNKKRDTQAHTHTHSHQNA